LPIKEHSFPNKLMSTAYIIIFFMRWQIEKRRKQEIVNQPFLEWWVRRISFSSSEMCMCWLTRRKCRSLCVCVCLFSGRERNANGRRLEWCRLDCALGAKLSLMLLKQITAKQFEWDVFSTLSLPQHHAKTPLRSAERNTQQFRQHTNKHLGCKTYYTKTKPWAAHSQKQRRSNGLIAFLNGSGGNKLFFMEWRDGLCWNNLASEQFLYMEVK